METEKELLDYFEPMIPGYSARIERISRGSINYTYRIHRTQDTTFEGSDDPVYSQSSVIAKYAAPYIAERGPSVKFSQYRQIIEAMALAMFDTRAHLDSLSIQLPKELRLLSLLEQHPSIRIPRPLGRSVRLNVLFTQDLAKHVPLEVWFKTKATVSTAKDAGIRLGSFIAALQVACRTHLPQYTHRFDNPDTRQFIRQDSAATVQIGLERLGYEDAAMLGKVVVEHYDAPIDPSLPAFAIGESSSGSLLIEGASADSIGIIDWEFAGVDSMAKDIAHCTAYLRLLSIADSDLEKVATAFGQGLIESYMKDVSDSLQGTPVQRVFTRSFLILCGTELIRSAMWKRVCCCQEQRCVHVKKQAELGVKYLRASGRGANTMDTELLKEEELLQLLLQLQLQLN